MKTRILLIVLSAPFVLPLAGCDTAQQLLSGMSKPTAKLAGFRFGEISLSSADLLFDVEVHNPYAVSLPLLDMDYAVASGENALFSGRADLDAAIPAKDKAILTLPVKIGYKDLLGALANLRDVRPGSTIPYQADVGLSMNTEALGALRLPLKKSGQVNVPELPKASDWKTILEKTLIR